LPSLTAILPSSTRLLTPPELGLAQLRIHGFSTLKPAEQLQAAALALRRDLSIEPAQLRLAVSTTPDSADFARIAFCTLRKEPASATPLTTALLAAMQRGKVFWVDAPAGFIVGEHGAATVDFAGVNEQLPAVVTDMLAAIDSPATATCVLVNRDRALVNDDRLAWWAAASGVAMVDGALPTATPVPLLPPPRARITATTTALDRALNVGAVAALLCAAIAGLRYASLPTPSTTATTSAEPASTARHATAGALLERISTIAPDVVTQTESATFASGTWVLALPAGIDAGTLARATLAMQANGLVAQSTGAPAPRIRVQLP
jgi:hypothetical protein